MKKNVVPALLLALLTGSLSAQAGSAALPRVNVATAAQPRAFVGQSAVKFRLEKLMGLVNARFLQKNFGTVSTLQQTAGAVAVTGCRPHACGGNGSLVVYDVRHDAFKVWLTVNDKTRVFSEKGFAAPLNGDVKAWVSNRN